VKNSRKELATVCAVRRENERDNERNNKNAEKWGIKVIQTHNKRETKMDNQ
jgi:hypothetical protein